MQHYETTVERLDHALDQLGGDGKPLDPNPRRTVNVTIGWDEGRGGITLHHPDDTTTVLPVPEPDRTSHHPTRVILQWDPPVGSKDWRQGKLLASLNLRKVFGQAAGGTLEQESETTWDQVADFLSGA